VGRPDGGSPGTIGGGAICECLAARRKPIDEVQGRGAELAGGSGGSTRRRSRARRSVRRAAVARQLRTAVAARISSFGSGRYGLNVERLDADSERWHEKELLTHLVARTLASDRAARKPRVTDPTHCERVGYELPYAPLPELAYASAFELDRGRRDSSTSVAASRVDGRNLAAI